MRENLPSAVLSFEFVLDLLAFFFFSLTPGDQIKSTQYHPNVVPLTLVVLGLIRPRYQGNICRKLTLKTCLDQNPEMAHPRKDITP